MWGFTGSPKHVPEDRPSVALDFSAAKVDGWHGRREETPGLIDIVRDAEFTRLATPR
ncbi:hypothetical protein HFX_1254 [Haloferax mediterranei ATCC 33500]|uniref:Uncharacterized protein n=1 Tax=Haloferax mediterranei (strain ATCC 33500 / DSM 1411 / JCM 8866 / NBRC 14739 / NCIMB 2177 / R-4) TaxID=523841 RepID=I3R406_HALMT|nr:hypothetical protein HFX_1254 [Haloferax mediterranei ATCC 33500]